MLLLLEWGRFGFRLQTNRGLDVVGTLSHCRWQVSVICQWCDYATASTTHPLQRHRQQRHIGSISSSSSSSSSYWPSRMTECELLHASNAPLKFRHHRHFTGFCCAASNFKVGARFNDFLNFSRRRSYLIEYAYWFRRQFQLFSASRTST